MNVDTVTKLGSKRKFFVVYKTGVIMLNSSTDKFGMLIAEFVRKESKKDALLKTREFGTKRRRSSVSVLFTSIQLFLRVLIS